MITGMKNFLDGERCSINTEDVYHREKDRKGTILGGFQVCIFLISCFSASVVCRSERLVVIITRFDVAS